MVEDTKHVENIFKGVKMEKVLVKWLNRITHRKAKPRKIECVEGVVFVLFKHSKVLVFIWKVWSGVKSV